MSANYLEEIGDIYDANIIEEGESVGKQDQLEQKDDALKHSGPEAAEGFDAAVEEEGGHAENLTQPVKKEKKEVKKESAEINNSTMKEKPQTNKSTFDRLFEDVMGGDLEMDLGGDEFGGDDHDDLGGEEEGGEVTLTLSADQADALREVLSQLDAGDDLGGDIDDIEDIEGEGDELESMESHVELQAAPDSIGSLTGQNNKAALSTDGGGADSSASGQEDGGKPKAAADGKAGLQGKSNKVSDLKGNAFSHLLIQSFI